MNAILDEHEIRGAVERMAARAGTPPLPGAAILSAGARRRTRRRAGAAGAVALAAALVVSVSWSVASSGPSAGPATGPTTTNPFTDQVARTLEQVLPGAKVRAWMFTDTNPATRHDRSDVFPLRITYRGHVSDAFLHLRAPERPENDPGYKADMRCHDTLPWKASRPECTAKDLPDGGILHAELIKGPGAWTARMGTMGGGDAELTMIEGDVSHSGVWAMLQVRGGTHSNGSGLTAATVGAALEDPRFTAFLNDFAAHPERDPYGPLATVPATVVADGTVGTHKWTLSFAVISAELPGGKADDNCDSWQYAVDGKSNGGMPEYTCQADGSSVHNPPPTNPSQPYPADQLYTGGYFGKPQDVIGSALSTTVPAGTTTVEATFDDRPAKLTGKVFTVHGDIPYFALVKPDSATPDWKKATVRCLDADGKEIGKLYFVAPGIDPMSVK